MPPGSTMKTLPLAVIRPKIAEPPLARLRMTEVASGWAKLTWAWLPMLKLSQLTIALLEPWVTSMRAPLLLMPTCPATTWPLVGNAVGDGSPAAIALAAPSASTVPMATAPEARLPRVRANSATAIQVLRNSLQTSR